MRRVAEAGFTLIELMIVVIIFGVVVGGLYEVLHRTRDSYELQRWVVESQENARTALQTISDDVRHVSYGKDPSQPSIDYAGPDSLVFLADLDRTVPGAENISYYLGDLDTDTQNPNDRVLVKTVADSSGTVLYSQPQSYGMSSNGFQLRYFNGEGVELANPVPSPEQIGEIEVTVTSSTPNRHRNGEYQEVSLSSTIYPRNLPLSPSRSRPSEPACGPISYPDCQSATLAWTTPTTNTDGTELAFTDISHFNFYLGTDPDMMTVVQTLDRAVNSWTESPLDPGVVYYLGVTCVSESGVESYMCRASAQVGSTLIPLSPGNPIAEFPVFVDGVRLKWDQVTLFDTGGIITTPVTYHVYRGTGVGFDPDPSNELGSTDVLHFDDADMEDCKQYFYKVTAEACGNESGPSAAVPASDPAPPSCPTGISGTLTPTPGTLLISWTPPTTRQDGSPLGNGDIGGYYVVYDTIPDTYSMEAHVPDGSATSALINNLRLCSAYYFNVRAYDVCPALGGLCSSEQALVYTSEPCNPASPLVPTNLTVHALDGKIELSWDANEVDCDLYGYRIYYGTESGGPYSGTGALEGNSPVEVSQTEVTAGYSCYYTLHNLADCQDYVVVVTAVDQCEPRNESAYSEEKGGQTACLPCNIRSSCLVWQTKPGYFNTVHLEVYSDLVAGEVVSRLEPKWERPGNIMQVYFGRPLLKVWDQDGSAGGDGPVGPQPSGSTLNVQDLSVDAGTEMWSGKPLLLVFDTDMRGTELTVKFRAPGTLCSTEGLVRHGVLLEDFDEGMPAGAWNFISGSWTESSGLLSQDAGNGEALAQHYESYVSDFIYSGKLFLSSRDNAGLVFRMRDPYNYYFAGIDVDDDMVYVQRVVEGVPNMVTYSPVTIDRNAWYTLTVRVSGWTIKVALNCETLIDRGDEAMWPSGTLGLKTVASKVYFDDLRASLLAVPNF